MFQIPIDTPNLANLSSIATSKKEAYLNLYVNIIFEKNIEKATEEEDFQD